MIVSSHTPCPTIKKNTFQDCFSPSQASQVPGNLVENVAIYIMHRTLKNTTWNRVKKHVRVRLKLILFSPTRALQAPSLPYNYVFVSHTEIPSYRWNQMVQSYSVHYHNHYCSLWAFHSQTQTRHGLFCYGLLHIFHVRWEKYTFC